MLCVEIAPKSLIFQLWETLSCLIQLPAKRKKNSFTNIEPLRVEEYFESAVYTPFCKRFDRWESKIREYVKDRGGRSSASAHSNFVKKILQGVKNPGDPCFSDADCFRGGSPLLLTWSKTMTISHNDLYSWVCNIAIRQRIFDGMAIFFMLFISKTMKYQAFDVTRCAEPM